ncbi:hypothetical protein [Solimicrobium silvestre]|uniref:Type 1 fimbrial protein n=1 Tax=Solimicrobium silvestre TaxID=2099400 RepID=A0A2S9H068_9BURK|nr:hypothetical protein [Solimicrobium silvestre]PRC93348.1 hypothetical protein S2091_2086 [Solimicrobium silvestre]
MCIHQQLPFLLLFASTLCVASDGVIRFTGRIVEPTCIVQTETLPAPRLNACSVHVALSTSVDSVIITPESHMLVWRANDVTKQDLPVNHWKIIRVNYL